jgi:hypothetical protein
MAFNMASLNRLQTDGSKYQTTHSELQGPAKDACCLDNINQPGQYLICAM